MADEEAEDEFLCERNDLFEQIEEKPEWFIKFIKFQFRKVCFGSTRLGASISDYNILESYALYKKDLKRLEEIENQGNAAEQMKRAAFLCYWLRRVSPIIGIWAPEEVKSGADAKPKELFLVKYANEYCPFDLGFRICRYFESRRFDSEGSEFRVMLELLNKERITVDLNQITSYNLGATYLNDVCALLKEKNVSPHALYLIYKSLFLNLNFTKEVPPPFFSV